MPSQARDSFYTTGLGGLPGTEARSFFIFNVPTFPVPLVAAELRVYAGSVLPEDGAVLFELRSVKAHPVVISNFSGSFVSNFNALAAGVVLGSRTIFGSQGRGHSDDPGAVIGIPLNADGLSEIGVRQGDLIAFGGVGPQTNAPSLVFAFNSTLPRRPQLVLYFSDAGAPEVTLVEPGGGREVLAGDRVNFAAVACGSQPMTLQWLRDGGAIPGATNEIFELSPMMADAGSYRLIASNELGVAASDPVEIGVVPFQIPEWTIGLWAMDGESDDTYLWVRVESLLPVEYQWRRQGADLAGETNNFLDFGQVTLQDSGEYDVVVNNAAGSRTSAVMTVTIEPRPLFFVFGDEVRRVAVGLPFELMNVALGSVPIHYQWYRNGEAVPGATSNVFRIGAAGFNDAGNYHVTAANPAGSITSGVYQVSVEPLIIPTEIAFWPLWLNPFAYEPLVGSSVPWSAQWYFHDQPIADGTNAALSFAAFDHTNEGPYFLVASNIYGAVTSAVTMLTVVTQAPLVLAYYGVVPSIVWMGEDTFFYGSAWGGPPPTIQWLFNGEPVGPPIPNALGGTYHYLPLSHVSTNQSGVYELMASNVFGVVTSPPLSLTVLADSPFFISLPLRTNEVAGSIVTVRAKALAGPPPVYQWRKDGVDLPGETNISLDLGEVQPGDSGVYEMVAQNLLGEARHAHALHVAPATGLDRWNWRLPRAQGSRLYQVAWGNGRYVAAGKSGNMITSMDGSNWTGVTIEADTDLRALAYGNGVFVAAGSLYMPLIHTNQAKVFDGSQFLHEYTGLVLVSSNGTSWSLGRNPEDNQLATIVFGNGVFVATGYYWRAPFAYRSTDGYNWTGLGPASGPALRIVFGNGTFLSQWNDDRFYYSSDGLSWTDSGVNGGFLIGFANGRFLSIQNSYTVLAESTDGRQWRALGPTPILYPSTVAGEGGAYVGLANLPPGQVLYSTDALNWLPVDTQTRQEIQSVTYVGGQFLAVGEAGTVTRSVNGLTWTADEIANKIDFYGVTHGKGMHLAAGDAGTILTSSNGIDWVRRNTPTSRNLHAVTFANGLFVAGGRSGTIMTSPDGANWTLRESGISNYVERIAWGNGLWVAVAEHGGISISSNGVDWAGSSTGPPFTDHEGVAYGNGVWVVVGGYFNAQQSAVSTVYISTNGLRWSAVTFDLGKRLRDVTFGRGMFVAVGNDGRIAHSTNGIGWTDFDMEGQNLRRVTYANGRFVGVGNDGTLLSSVNPSLQLPWSKHRSRTSQNLHDIHAAPDGTFLYVGNNGMVLQSGNTLPRFLSINSGGWIEFDSGIAENLRLERSTDLKTWELDDLDVRSPMLWDPFGPNGYWRLVGD